MKYEANSETPQFSTLGPEQEYKIIDMRKPFCCPVCEGRGVVQCGFYDMSYGANTYVISTEQCRTCGGTGVIWRE